MDNEASLEYKISTTIKKSRLSFFSTLFFLVVIFVVLFALFQQVKNLQDTTESLNKEVKLKESEVRSLNEEITTANDEIEESKLELENYNKAIEIFHIGLRRLQSRQYHKAIEAFSNFIDIVPGSPQAFHILGYSEYRYFLHWKENLINQRGQVSLSQQVEWENLTKEYYDRATNNFKRALELNESYMWPEYHMILLDFYADNYDQSMKLLKSAVNKHPEMLDYLCDDGEFRKIRKHQETKYYFVETISNALNSNNQDRKSCWVVSAFKSTLISEIQRFLNELGYDAGVPDGIAGIKTVLAVKNFEKNENMEITGIPNDALLVALQQVSKDMD